MGSEDCACVCLPQNCVQVCVCVCVCVCAIYLTFVHMYVQLIRVYTATGRSSINSELPYLVYSMIPSIIDVWGNNREFCRIL